MAPERDPRLCLPRGARVIFAGQPYRVVERCLDPGRRAGLGRVSYDLEPSLRMPDGEFRFGVFKPVHGVAARHLEVDSKACPLCGRVTAVLVSNEDRVYKHAVHACGGGGR